MAFIFKMSSLYDMQEIFLYKKYSVGIFYVIVDDGMFVEICDFWYIRDIKLIVSDLFAIFIHRRYNEVTKTYGAIQNL